MADQLSNLRKSPDQHQQLLDFALPADEATRRKRIREIRHHFLCLLEDFPERDGPLSPEMMRIVKAMLKRLLKSDVTNWYGIGTFCQADLARDWIVPYRTLRYWFAGARTAKLISTSISAGDDGRKRTTVEFCWHSIASRLGRSVLPSDPDDGGATGNDCRKQAATTADQAATTADQAATTADQAAMIAALSGTGYSKASASTGEPAPWSAAAAAVLRLCPGLNLGCLSRAREVGCTPAEIVAIARYWRSRDGCWGSGALYRRIQHAVPGIAATDGWPAARHAGVVRDTTLDAETERGRLIRSLKAEGMHHEAAIAEADRVLLARKET